MKKYIINICTVAIAILSVISCTNESVEIKKQVQITISPSKVLKDIVPFYNPSDIDMYQEEGNAAKLKLIALIYDKNGNLYHKSEKIVKDYNSDYTFSILVDEEEYRILAFSYSVLEIDGETHSAYSISNTDKQNNLKIQQGVDFGHYIVLGNHALLIKVVYLFAQINATYHAKRTCIQTRNGFFGSFYYG